MLMLVFVSNVWFVVEKRPAGSDFCSNVFCAQIETGNRSRDTQSRFIEEMEEITRVVAGFIVS